MGIRERIIAVAITLPSWVLLLTAAPTLVAAQADMARMKSDYRRPPPSTVDSQVLVDLGRDLFFDPQILENSLRQLPLPRAGLDGDGRPQPKRFRQAHFAQVATADRIGPCRQRPVRLGRPQPEPGSASEVVDRHRFDVDAGHRDASQSRGDRGTIAVKPCLRRKVSSRIAGRAHQHRFRRPRACRLRARIGARARRFRPLGRGRRERDLRAGQARLRAFQHQSDLLCLPHRLEIHRRPFP